MAFYGYVGFSMVNVAGFFHHKLLLVLPVCSSMPMKVKFVRIDKFDECIRMCEHSKNIGRTALKLVSDCSCPRVLGYFVALCPWPHDQHGGIEPTEV